ncbi:hypothetical protein I4U23_023315 [Adineta vaga]|nr:hypothetical protein I4U23_023315 [Adineta vaga]
MIPTTFPYRIAIAPTMSYLAANVHVHYCGMDSALVSRGFGYSTASILDIMLQTVVRKLSYGLLACGFIFATIAMFVIPFTTSLLLIYGLIGRFFAAILSICLSPYVFPNIVWFACLSLATAWFTFEVIIGMSQTTLFILGAATGLLFSPAFPLSIGFVNQRLNVTPVLVALLAMM